MNRLEPSNLKPHQRDSAAKSARQSRMLRGALGQVGDSAQDAADQQSGYSCWERGQPPSGQRLWAALSCLLFVIGLKGIFINLRHRFENRTKAQRVFRQSRLRGSSTAAGEKENRYKSSEQESTPMTRTQSASVCKIPRPRIPTRYPRENKGPRILGLFLDHVPRTPVVSGLLVGIGWGHCRGSTSSRLVPLTSQ